MSNRWSGCGGALATLVVATKVLGGGANVLIDDDGFDGLVIRLDAPVFRSCVRRNGGVRVGAGADFMRLAETCSKQGWSGLEGMAAIPGTLGGAVRMNAGGRYGYIADVLHEATMLTHQGALETWTKDPFRIRLPQVGGGGRDGRRCHAQLAGR